MIWNFCSKKSPITRVACAILAFWATQLAQTSFLTRKKTRKITKDTGDFILDF